MEMKKMTKIYQLMIENEQINDVYYNEDDARANATQIHSDLGMTVTIWEAEEIADAPYDVLEWTTLITIRFD